MHHHAHELGDDLYRRNVVEPVVPEGGLPFTCTPFAAVVLRGLSLVPFPQAVWFWAVLNCSCLVAVVHLLGRAWSPRRRTLVCVAALAATTTAAHVAMGQVNAVLALLVLVDCTLLQRASTARWWPRGLGVGLAAGVKLTPAVVVVFFLLTRRWRTALVTAATSAATVVVGAVLLPRPTTDFVTLLPRLGERVDVLGCSATSYDTGVVGLWAQAGVTSPWVPLVVPAAVVAAGLLLARWAQPVGAEVSGAILLLTSCAASPVTWIHHRVVLPVVLAWALAHDPGRGLRRALRFALVVQLTGSTMLAAPQVQEGARDAAAATGALARVVGVVWGTSPVWSAVLFVLAVGRVRARTCDGQGPAGVAPPTPPLPRTRASSRTVPGPACRTTPRGRPLRAIRRGSPRRGGSAAR